MGNGQERAHRGVTLDSLGAGGVGIIRVVGGEGALRQHFLDMGVIPGPRYRS